MKSLKNKVFAYVTYQQRLLVFRHPHAPQAGIQVPTGTIKPNEQPAEAVLREVWEETGLDDLILDGFLGEQVRDMADMGREEIHHRYFYHLRCSGHPPETWQHEESDPSEELKRKPLFEFFWVRLPERIPLRSDYKRPEEPDVLPRADAVVVFPATFNTLNKWALGITDTLTLGILCEYTGLKKPILAVPGIHTHLALTPILRLLRRYGVHVLYEPDDHPPNNKIPATKILCVLDELVSSRFHCE